MRSIWLLSGLLALLAVIPASAQQSSSAPADQTTQASAAAPADPAPAATPAPQATQTPAPAATPAAAPAPPVWSLGPIDFAGTVDGYYGFNFNHPQPDRLFSDGTGGNSGAANYLYNFDIPTNQFSLNMVKLGMSHQPDPVGFEFDIGYGDTMQAINSVSSTEFDKIVEQAYVSFKPMKAKGFEIDFGKFVTTAGAEVIESYSNWNYSRSLLFSWAIPYYHYGIRTSWPMGKHWTGGFQLVNGWNDTLAVNTAATLGANIMGTYAKWNWMFDWYGGPENAGTNQGWRNLYDTTLNLTPSAKFAAYINYDYGTDSLYNNSTYANGTEVHYQGIAGAAHYMPNSKWSVTGRYEWFDDPDGFAMLGAGLESVNNFPATPVSQHVQEFTGTVEYKFLEGLMWRGEYRYDWSDQPFFLTGSSACTEPEEENPTVAQCPAFYGLGNSKHQQTLTFAVIAFFGPKRAGQ
jgi:hypothetical protein